MDIRKILSLQKNVDIQLNLPDGVIYIGNNGIIQWANDIAHDLFHTEIGLLLTKSVNDILENGYNLVKNSANTHKALIAKSTQGDEYYEITSRETEEGFVVSMRDSTQNYKRISEILEEQENAQKVNGDKNIFLVKLANEFNSPIQSIIGFSQGIIDGLGGKVSDKQAKYANIIKKNSSDLLYFFTKLVELSQSEGHLIENDNKHFDVVTYVDNIIKSNKSLYAEKNLNIEYNIDGEFKRSIYQNESYFKLMMNNIIETVLREIEMGNICVTISEADEEFLTARNLPVNSSILITISSNNVAILETEISTLFNPYAVIDSANKRTISRALALGTASNAAKILGGAVWAEILPMKGFVYNIVIPRKGIDNE